MPLWAKIYVVVFLLFTVSNMGYYIYLRSKLVVIAYDFFCGIFFAAAMISYWRPFLKGNLNLFVAVLFFGILLLEFYLSVMDGYKELGIKIPEEMTDSEMDKACAISLIFSAPAYIVGGLSMLDIIFGKI
ncbi:MAG TPA: hypothetical protein PK821_02680 [Victivallales bacterium]|nr:hypothetical protein [Victivallales bacterium]